MTSQTIHATSLSGPPVSRWLGFFPEFRQDSLGFLLRCHSYGDVVKLPMGRMAELLFRQQDFAMYLLNNPADVKHVLVTNQHNYTKNPVPPVEARIFGKGILHTEDETHHRQRRIFLPFFHGDHVASYTNLITKKNLRPCRELARQRHRRHRTRNDGTDPVDHLAAPLRTECRF